MLAADGGLRTDPNRDAIGHSPYTDRHTYRHTAAYGDSHPDVHADAHTPYGRTHPHSDPNAVARLELDRF